MRADLLEALERGEIDQVARPAIAQAHRRLYARYLGFDAKSIRGGGPLGVPATDCKAAKLAARLRGAPRGDAPEPPPDAEPPSQADVFAGAEAGASEPEPPPEPPTTASPPPQPWWFRRSVMVAAVVVFCVGLLVSIVLALAAGYGQAG